MDFFAHQQQALRQTRSLMLLFALCAIGVALALGALAAILLSKPTESGFWPVLLVTSGLVMVSILLASLFETLRLSSGGSAVARGLGALEIHRDSTDAQYRRLLNIVEEMAIASGVPCPAVFVLEQESSINAFAAGFALDDAAVCVTRGAMELLSRDELQGVIAHEFSHIFHGDMRLNIRMMGVLFGLMVLGLIGRQLLRARGKGAERVALVGLVLIVLGYGGMLLGRIIKARVSRTREFAADASAVQFTRQSSGLAGALKKIGGLNTANDRALVNAKAEDVAHMLFADGVSFAGLLATHPPLAQRIRALDPQFSEAQFGVLMQRAWTHPGPDAETLSCAELLGLAPSKPASSAAPIAATVAPTARAPGATQQVLAAIGNPQAQHVQYGHAAHARLAPLLHQAAQSRTHAASLVLGLAVVAQADRQQLQLTLISDRLGRGRCDSVSRLLPVLAELEPSLKLPLVSLAFASLKLCPLTELRETFSCLNELVQHDGQLSIFEYCLLKTFEYLLLPDAQPVGVRQSSKLAEHVASAQLLLSLMAQLGLNPQAAPRAQPSEAAAARTPTGDQLAAAKAAYAAGALVLNLSAAFVPQSLSGDVRALCAQLDQALRETRHLAPFAKRMLIQALSTTLHFDGNIAPSEAELLRVICLSLQAPMPPLLDALAA